MRRSIGLMAGALALASCAAPTAEGQRVRIVNSASVVEKCEMLQAMEEYSGWGGIMAGQGYRNNIASMRNKAAQIGGDTLLVVDKSGGFGSSVIAEAYRCKQ